MDSDDHQRKTSTINSPNQKNTHPIFDNTSSVDLYTNPAFQGTHTESKPIRCQTEDGSLNSKQLSYKDALIHLVKSCLGAGVLAVPNAFYHGGIILSPVLSIVIASLCIHCFNILAKTSLELSGIVKKNNLSYPETAEEAFNYGANKRLKGLAIHARRLVEICLFSEQFGVVIVYILITAATGKEILFSQFNINIDIRWCLLAILVILLTFGLIRHLKHLVPFSFIAIILTIVAIIIVLYFSMHNVPTISSRKYYTSSLQDLVIFISSIYFAMQTSGTILSIRNSMKHPAHFHRSFSGVIAITFTIVTTIYVIVGFFGYLKFGNKTEPDIIFNLPNNGLSLTIKTLFAIALLFNCQVAIIGAIDAIWDNVKSKFPESNEIIIYTVIKELLFISAVLLAVVIPSIMTAMSLVGSFAYILGLAMPAVIEMVYNWDIEISEKKLKMCKNTIIIIFSLVAVIFGITQSLADILHKKSS